MDDQQYDPIENEVLNFSFTIKQINYILSILAEVPFAKSATAITWINMQGEPQFQQILERTADESQTTPKESGN